MDEPWRDVDAAGDWLLSIEARVGPTVVHLNGYAHGALPWRSPLVVAGHSCVASWADAVAEQIGPDLEQYRRAVTNGLRAADWVVSPSAWMLSALETQYGRLPRKTVVPNGRDRSRFQPATKAPFVFTAGRLWDRAKNVQAVAAAAPRLSWPVIAAGEGRIDGIRCLGRLSERDLGDCLGRASIFALPARYEPFGLLPLEAALSGCALVLGNIASLREVWSDAAVFVDPDDVESIRGEIERLIARPALLRNYAVRARDRALTYTPERMAAGYVDVYRLACSASQARSLTCAS
jgi:glycosyltransferase involved in cell wall biosynthesis